MYRISSNQLYLSSESSTMKATVEYNRLNHQIATGKKVEDASDDPVAKKKIMNENKIIQESDTYTKNANEATYQLESAENALKSVHDTLDAVKELTLRMANDTANAEDRALARETVLKAMSDIIADGNTQMDGFYIFGGYSTAQQPFSSPDGTYQGDDFARSLEIAPSVYKQVSFPGNNVLTGVVNGVQTGTNVFTTLTGLAEDLLNNDGNAIRNRVGELDSCLNQVSVYQSKAGNQLQEVEVASSLIQLNLLQSKTRKTDYEEIDVASAMTQLASLKTSLEATMSATAQALQVTLLNYLK